MSEDPGTKTRSGAKRGQGQPRTFGDGLRLALSVPGVILLASSAGFGALADDAGLSLFNAVFMMGVFFALPAQVVMMDQLARGGSIVAGSMAVLLTAVRLLPMVVAIQPVLTDDRPALWRRLLAVHFVAVTAWLEGLRHLPSVPPGQRMTVFLGLGTGCVAATLVGTAVGFLLAGSVPSTLAAVLLFLTPVYFLLSLMAAARKPMDWIAIVAGAFLGPLFYVLTPGFDLLLAGVVGGTFSYFAGLRVESFLGEESE